MTLTTCTPVITTRTGGRVAFDAQSLYASDWTRVEGDTRPSFCNGAQRCTDCARQSSRGNADQRLRLEYAQGSRPVCALCLLPGSFALGMTDDARLVVSHTIAVARYGSASSKNLHASHVVCNGDAGTTDLRAYVPVVVRDLPPLKAAQAWARTPHRLHVPAHLPTAADMREARAARILADGTIGLPF